jgi:hypothetical protein
VRDPETRVHVVHHATQLRAPTYPVRGSKDDGPI